jgi:hypothetical protein
MPGSSIVHLLVLGEQDQRGQTDSQMGQIESLGEIEVFKVGVWLTGIFSLSVLINVSRPGVLGNRRHTFGSVCQNQRYHL